ncbi:MAG: spore maturation protein [Clostridia bacterium]|nr:spore maturation protein [Clostridia bacterium]MBQ9786175.1 spore maturation protein [Clostridia bacterium]
MNASQLVVPILIILLLLYAWRKKVNAFGSFVNGAKGAVDLCIDILPFLVAIFVAVELFRVSGLAVWLSKILAPAFGILGIPIELCELVLLRPFSGSASTALIEEIFRTYGPDSYIARAGSVIMGSSETVFYVATVYFSQTKTKRLLYAIPVALFACLVSAIFACFICKFM